MLIQIAIKIPCYESDAYLFRRDTNTPSIRIGCPSFMTSSLTFDVPRIRCAYCRRCYVSVSGNGRPLIACFGCVSVSYPRTENSLMT